VRGYLTLLLTLAAIWGASFMFIEVALEDLEPATLMAARVLIAAAALLTILAVRGSLASLRRAGWQGFALGLINSALPFTLIAWGQQYIDSGVAAIANASVPIWVAVFAIWMRHSERATGARLLGIVLGLVGVGILTGAQPDVTGEAMIGTLAVVVASICYGLGSLLLQDRMDDLDPLTLSTAAVCGAAIALLPFGLAQLPDHAPDAETVWSVIALGLAGTAVGMVMFLKIIESYGSFRAGLVTYLLPVTALLYGALLLGEAVNGWMLLGLALILSGVALGSGLVRPARRAPEVAEAAPP
jgi:drug/metabolite transporter (DMT)-like permease